MERYSNCLSQGTKARLEQQVENLNNKVKDHERLKRDNLELKNQVQGQHSIIAGLRKERELWSKELVQQGLPGFSLSFLVSNVCVLSFMFLIDAN